MRKHLSRRNRGSWQRKLAASDSVAFESVESVFLASYSRIGRGTFVEEESGLVATVVALEPLDSVALGLI